MTLEEALPDYVIDKNEFKDNEVVVPDDTTGTSTTDTEPVKSGGVKWTAFMGHVAHTEIENLKMEMEKFEAHYVMSAEVGAYEHFHFLAKITEKQYYNFCKRVFKDKYNLRGRAINDKPRQYGKVTKIKDLSKMMAYTLKDKNYITNMTQEEIEAILKSKIEDVKNTKNSESREIKEKMIKYVDNKLKELLADKKCYRHEKYIRIAIISFLLEKKMNIIRATIERYYWYYVANTNTIFKQNEYSIYNELYDNAFG
jgi:hypothetical protein